MSKQTIEVFKDHLSLANAAARLFADLAVESVQSHGRFLVALSGGSTPQPVYQCLTEAEYRERIPWDRTHFFWGDERLVPPQHPESNYGAVKTLLLDTVAAPSANVHRVKVGLDPQEAVDDYLKQLAQFAEGGMPWPRFDFVLLGLGSDGHTASLFPGGAGNEEQAEGVILVEADYQGRPAARLTLNAQVFNAARNVAFLVVGEDKAEALAAVISGPNDPRRWPAQRIRPPAGVMRWFVDQSAAKLLGALP